MKHDFVSKAAVPLLAATAALTLTHAASAAPDCATLPSATYVTGSSAVKPFMAALGKALAGTTTIVYKGQGSCTGVDAILNGTKVTGTASFWDVAGLETTCNLNPAGDVADVGVSDVFAKSCAGVTTVPPDVGDFFGPNQVMNFIVPAASSQTSISAEAAYFVFGFGAAAGKVAPWTVDTNVFIRSASSGTQTMLSFAINVPSTKWKGVAGASSGAVFTSVSTSVDPESTIGIISSDFADVNRDKIKALAYQHYKQKCAYWPDSSPTAFDKINVRDGHYPVWGPLHLLAKVNGSNVPVKANAASLIGYFTGAVPTPAGVNLLDLEITSHTVPACAMQVKRSTELGDVSASIPATPCGCYFEQKAGGSTTCSSCKVDSDCSGAAKHCRYGYCEAN